MKKTMGVVRSLDFLGSDISLNVKGSSAVKTIFGAFLSVVCAVVLILGMGVLVMDYFDKSKPNVIQILKENEQFPKIDLFANPVVPPIALFDAAFQPIPRNKVPRYGSFVSALFSYSFTTENGAVRLIETKKFIPMIPCDQLSPEVDNALFKDWKSLGVAQNIKQTYGYCVSPEKDSFVVHGKPNDRDFTWFAVMFVPCSLPTGCASDEEVASLYLNIPLIKKTVIPGDYDQPLQTRALLEDTYPVSPFSLHRLENKLRINTVVDSAGFLTEDTERARFADIGVQFNKYAWRNPSVLGCDLDKVPRKGCQPYNLIVFTSSGAEQIFQRTYVGLFETLGNIGGLKEIVMIAIGLLYMHYHAHAEAQFLRENVFRLSQDAQAHARLLQLDAREAKKLQAGLKDTADGLVEHYLDAVTIVRELATLRLLVEALMHPPALRVQSFASLTLRKKRLDEKRAAEAKCRRTGPDEAPDQTQNQTASSKSKLFSFEQAAEYLTSGLGPCPGVSEFRPAQPAPDSGRPLREQSAAEDRVSCLLQRILREARETWAEKDSGTVSRGRSEQELPPARFGGPRDAEHDRNSAPWFDQVSQQHSAAQFKDLDSP